MIRSLCTTLDIPVLWEIVGILGLLLAALDFFGLTAKVERFIDVRVRGALESFLAKLSTRAKRFEAGAKAQLTEARQSADLKAEIYYEVHRELKREPWKSRLAYATDYDRQARFKAIRKRLLAEANGRGVTTWKEIPKDAREYSFAEIMAEPDYLKLRSDGETLVSWIAILCLVLTVVTWSPVMLFFMIAYISYFIFRGTYLSLYYLFIFLLGGAFFFLVRITVTAILYAVVGPLVAMLHVLDKPPSGTMGSIGFALAVASYGQEKLC